MSKTNSIIARSLRFGLTALLLFVASVAANADDFSSGGLGYSILSFSDKTCEVCCYYSSCSGNVVIPETVKYLSTTYTVISIGSSALKGCTGLTEMTIPNTVTSIGDYAFYGCSGLNSISISNSVTEIGYYTFYGCSGLTGSLNIPDGVTSIGSHAFDGCSGLTEITIPNSVTEIGYYAFYKCSGLTGTLTIPDGVTIIDDYTFDGCSGLTSLTLGNSVTSIGRSAFCECTGLTGDLIIPNSVKTIGYMAFEFCQGLTSLTLGNSVTTIGGFAFAYCYGLTGTLTIPESVTSIGDFAFEGCRRLTEINIPEGVTEIGEYAFWDCTSLTEVTIPNSVTSIGSFAFDGCTGLTQITIGESVTKIYSSAFRNCTSLTKIEVAEDNEYYCSQDGVLFSKDMKSLIRFPPASSLLPSYDIPESVTTIGSCAFYKCTSLMEITIPNSVTEIGESAFDGCTGLTEVTIGNSVETIFSSAFEGCTGLASLTLGKSVTTIGKNAFYAYGGTGLTSITSLNPEPPTCSGSSVFYYGITGTCILSVPARSTSAYSTADTWKEFKNIVGIDVYSPTVQTLRETAVTSSTATLNGTVTAGEDEILEKGFEYWCADGEIETVKCTGEEMSVTITGLESGATYTYRAYAKTESGTTYGSKVEFTTLIPTTVLVYEATDVTSESATLHGYVEAGSEEIQECGFEYWGTNGVVNTVVVAEGDMSATLTGLTPNVTYGYRAYAKTESGTTRSENMGFSTVIPPTVQTYEATNVTESSALLSGYVEAGSEYVWVKGFECWAEGGEIWTCGMAAEELPMEVTFVDLDHGTTYTYRAYATTASGTTYGETLTFTTLGTATITPPTVQTYAVTDITYNSATLNGIVTVGSEEIEELGFEYWRRGGEIQTIAMADQMMAVTITGLNEGTTYTCRAYAKTASGTTYGNEVTFTTLGTATITPPTVQTYEATEITESSATLSGVVAAGSEKVTEQGFEYWSSSSDVQAVASTSSSMSVTVANLKSSTTYTYRAYAKTESGTTYGETVSFTTLDYADGVSNVNAELEVEARYTTDGKKVSQPQRGINIIRYSDGTARKVLVK